MIKYAKLDLKVDIKCLQNETEKIINDSVWYPHFNYSHYKGNWEVLALRSPGGMENQIIPDLMNETGFANTSLMGRFSSVQKLIENLDCPVLSVRLLNLKTGAEIKPHRDQCLCFEKGEVRIHIPVFTNPFVQFFIEDECIEMKEGETWYINANGVHNVSNFGSTDRIHLVIDCKVNEWLKNIFEKSEKVMINEKQNNEEIEKIIKELRLQNTETSNKLADDLSKNI